MSAETATTASSEVTHLLLAWGQGDEVARDHLVPLVYGELKRMARNELRREQKFHTLQSAALIHEAYLRLVEQPVTWQGRAHFFGIAARLMRQILINHAHSRQRLKRGGMRQQLSLSAVENLVSDQPTDLLALDDALQNLAVIDSRKSQVVELRFFGGLTIEETATVLGISTPTVEREWRAARAWLQTELSGS